MNVKSNKKRKTRKIRLGMKASVIQNGVRISTPIKNNPRVIVRTVSYTHLTLPTTSRV